MIIEQNTNYAYKLKYMENPTFDKVRDLAIKSMNEFPKQLQDKLCNALNRGDDILDSEPKMVIYLYAYGPMHQAKLNYAFRHLPEKFLTQPEINIFDYGCGQALGTMCYADFLRENGYSQKVKTITLIEPSEICLKRAALHASVFFPNAEIKTVNKTFGKLDKNDIYCDDGVPNLNILNNVFDTSSFDIKALADMIKNQINGYNQFVCIEPYYSNDERMVDFYYPFHGEIDYYEELTEHELDSEKDWDACILCFSVEYFHLTRVTTIDEIKAVKDGFGALYSKDGKRLIKMNSDIENYTIKDGTRVICDNAFESSQLRQIVFPDSVLSIGEHAFNKCSQLQQVIIPDSVLSIGENAFNECSSLQQIIIPDSVLSIGKYAFEKCSQLRQIIIPDSVKSIEKGTFSGCSALQQIIIPNSILSIGDNAFSWCLSLKQIIIPNSVVSIGNSAFWGCGSLKRMTIHNSIESIGDNPFCGCDKLTLTSESYRFTIQNGLLIDNQSNKIISYLGKDNSVFIPNTVTSIGNSAFGKCSSLIEINIPDSVTSIGQDAFDGCTSLRQITIPSSVTSIGRYAFWGCDSLLEITIPDLSMSIEQWLPNNSDEDWVDHLRCHLSMKDCLTENTLKVTILDSVTRIWDRAFLGCSFLEEVIIPNSVTCIGSHAFSGCKSLQRITIPDSVTRIEESAFEDCTSLQKISIPNSVKCIEWKAFYGCTSLMQINIPKGSTEEFIRRLEFTGRLNERLWEKLVEE